VLQKRVGYFTILLFTIFQQTLIGQDSKPFKVAVNWSNYLSTHDMVWNALPKDYFDGAFVGNGLLGTILFKDDVEPNTLRFEIGRTDVYDHRTPNASAYETSRLPIGQLLFTPVGEILKTNIRTDLWNAEIRGSLVTTKGTIQFRCYVPSAEEVIVLDITATGTEDQAKVTFRPQEAISARYLAKKYLGGEKGVVYPFNPPPIVDSIDGIGVATQNLLMGDDYATAWKDQKRQNGKRTVLVSVANGWGTFRKAYNGSAKLAVGTIKKVQKKSMTEIESVHRNWWHHFYPASFVSIPDTRMESFYWIQLYKLASATHPNRPVIDLLGPWFKPTSWPLLWMNLNVQLTYYTLGITNHSDLESNLYQLIERHKDQIIQNVPPAFQADCAGIRNPVQFDNLYAPLFLSEDKNNDKEMNIIVLPWLTQMYYLHYRRLMDDSLLLHHVYPLLKRAFSIYTHILYLGDDGKYHIPYTYSDEYGNAKETSLNIALASWGYHTLIDCVERLKIKEPLLAVWKDRLNNLADINTNENGIMVGKNLPFTKPHRHYSHLFTIFPLYDRTIDNRPDFVPTMRQSIMHFTNLDGDNCMYKFSGAASLWASIGNGDSALHWLKRSLELLPRFGKPPGPSRIPTCTSNTFYSERENPTFESPIASSRSMLDFMLQSYGDVVRVFPACPSEWKNVRFHNLKAEGAFEVSAVRENGRTSFIRIKSLAGETCKLKTDFTENYHIEGNTQIKVSNVNGVLVFTLPKGKEIIFYQGKRPKDYTIEPLASLPNQRNQWGEQK
jgi:hypothetical protein